MFQLAYFNGSRDDADSFAAFILVGIDEELVPAGIFLVGERNFQTLGIAGRKQLVFGSCQSGRNIFGHQVAFADARAPWQKPELRQIFYPSVIHIRGLIKNRNIAVSYGSQHRA